MPRSAINLGLGFNGDGNIPPTQPHRHAHALAQALPA